MRFDQKLMNYAIGEELTKAKIKNCRIMIEKQFTNGCTPLQLVTMQSILKTMKKELKKIIPICCKGLKNGKNYFNYNSFSLSCNKFVIFCKTCFNKR